MDNELEIVSNNANTIPTEVMAKAPTPVKTVLPVVGGAAAVFTAGMLFMRFVVEPVVRKVKANKAAKKAQEAAEAKPEE